MYEGLEEISFWGVDILEATKAFHTKNIYEQATKGMPDDYRQVYDAAVENVLEALRLVVWTDTPGDLVVNIPGNTICEEMTIDAVDDYCQEQLEKRY